LLHRKITSLVTRVVTRLHACNRLQGYYKLVMWAFGLVMAKALQACNKKPKTKSHRKLLQSGYITYKRSIYGKYMYSAFTITLRSHITYNACQHGAELTKSSLGQQTRERERERQTEINEIDG
jgi:hypothetical protein